MIKPTFVQNVNLMVNSAIKQINIDLDIATGIAIACILQNLKRNPI